MPTDFAGRVVLVTGASRGIGAAIAEAFAVQGALVVVNHLRNAAAADAVVARCQVVGGDAWAEKADVTDAAAVQAMVHRVLQETGRIDVVVNNAGVFAMAPFAETTAADARGRGTRWPCSASCWRRWCAPRTRSC